MSCLFSKWVTWTVVAACSILPAAAEAKTTRNKPAKANLKSTVEIQDQLEIGARVYMFLLEDTVRVAQSGRPSNFNVDGNYVGSLWGLEEIQDYVPRLYAQYAFVPNFGIGLSYDYVAARTQDWGDLYATSIEGDGNVEVWGPLIYLFLRYPNPTPFRPYAELGGIYYFADFDETAEWAATGPGYRMEVDDTVGVYLAFGVDVTLHESWAMDVYLRYLYGAEVDARAYFKPGSTVGRSGSFPLDYIMVGLGLSHRF